ncbi:uncharacterized protein [Nicotiana tomentosiformis]|uniref:uncharacterized protein n=1 Tax=Nicotiana tomentosiformis TaxID=4098 RepID=UPI00388C5A9F
MLLQITCQDKATQTDPDNTMKNLLLAMTTLCKKVKSMDEEIQIIRKTASSQQHDSKNAEIRRSEVSKIPELEGDVEKHLKTHNSLLNTVAGSSTTSSSSAKKKEEIKPRYTNINMNNLFSKPFVQKNIQNTQNEIFLPPQINTYKESLNQAKKTYNHITRTYIDNIHKIQNFLNKNPRSQTTQNPNEDYITHYLTGYNKLIALPNTSAKLIATCYNYGLLDTVYIQTGQEIATIPELHRAFMQYKRITKGTLFYIRFYSATTEILYEEIKPIIQVIKIGLTREMLVPEKIEEQEEIEKINIPDFYANKRIIGISTILNELANNYLNQNAIWSYYSREQTMIYSNCREIREADMEELRQWVLSLLKPEQPTTTRAIRTNFISPELLTRYCKLISHKYPDHICSKCKGEDNIVPDVQLE